MGLICFGSVRSSPGVTATVLALAARWPTPPPPVVIEADPDGGVLASRYSLGRAGESPGLTSLATAVRRGLGAGEVWRHAQELPGGLALVVGPDSAEAASATVRSAGEGLGRWLAIQPDVAALVDCGRLRPGSPALELVRCASQLVVVVRPRVEELQALSQRLGALRQLAEVGLILVGDRPYGSDEVAKVLGVEILGVIADDPRAALALEGDGVAGVKRLRRSALARTAAGLAEQLGARGAIDVDADEGAPQAPAQPWMSASAVERAGVVGR